MFVNLRSSTHSTYHDTNPDTIHKSWAYLATALRSAIDLNLFDVAAATAGGGGQIQVSHIVNETGADTQLISKFFW